MAEEMSNETQEEGDSLTSALAAAWDQFEDNDSEQDQSPEPSGRVADTTGGVDHPAEPALQYTLKQYRAARTRLLAPWSRTSTKSLP